MRPMARVGLAVMGFMLRGCKKIVKGMHEGDFATVEDLRAPSVPGAMKAITGIH